MKGYIAPTSGDGSKRSAQEWETVVIDTVGSFIEFWGFKHNQGRIWALLYLRGIPMSAGEIQDALDLSKGAVSMIIRELEQWRVIRRVRRPQTSSWFYEAEQDLMAMVGEVLRNRENNVISRVRTDLEQAVRQARSCEDVSSEATSRLEKMRDLAALMQTGIQMFLATGSVDLSQAMHVLQVDQGGE